jgi:hypothetical protein
MAIELRMFSAPFALVAVTALAGLALAEPAVPPGKIPAISGQSTANPQGQTPVVCPAEMIRVGNSCECGPGGVKTSPTTCAVRAFVPLQTGGKDN